MMRGRGGPSRGRKGPFRPQRIVTKPVFDREFMNLGEDARISPPPDDAELTQAMVKRHADLTPTSQEQAAVLNLVTNITSAADALIVSPASFPGCQLEEVRPVGSFRKATMMRGRNVADVVIILKTMPTKEAVEQLGVKLHSDLQAVDGLAGVQLEQNDTGFILSTSDAKVRCLITTIAQNVRSLDRELHLDIKVVQAHLAAIRHSCWFEDNGRYSTVKVMIRLLKDMAARFDGFAPLKSWMIDMLAHYATMNTQDGQPLPINIAFRRVLQLLASGFFLPTSFSINDPCETSVVKVHSQMTLEEQDVVCMTAQMLVRMLAYGGYKEILGLEGNGNLNEPKVYGGVTITPPERVYERREGTTDTLEEGDGAAQMEVAE